MHAVACATFNPPYKGCDYHMPIILDDLIAEVQSENTFTQVEYTPKMFHRDLNGQGKKGGRINKDVHPANIDDTFTPDLSITLPMKPHTKDDTETRYVPTAPILVNTLKEAIDNGFDAAECRKSQLAYGQVPNDLDDYPWMFQVAAPSQDDLDDERVFTITDSIPVVIDEYTLFADFAPQRVIVRSVKTVHDDGSSTTAHSTHVYYKITIFAMHDSDINVTVDANTGERAVEILVDTVPVVRDLQTQNPLQFSGVKSFALVDFSLEPQEAMQEMTYAIQERIDNVNRSHTATIDTNDFFDFGYNRYSLYQRLSHEAEVFATDAIGDYMVDFLNQNFRDMQTIADVQSKGVIDPIEYHEIAWQLRYLEHFTDIPLSAYAKIFDAIDSISDKRVAQDLLKQNMQLSLNSNLKSLAEVKDVLPRPLDPANPVSTYPLDPMYSQQQSAAITSNEPCVMVPSGAGTGKSSVIVERMKFLNHHGVPYQEIAAWSFTNAAADNLTARFPEIASSTIASAYMDTYEANFPTHKLSSLDTILTSLEIFYGDSIFADDFLTTFQSLIRNARDNSNAAMTALANFTELHLVEVISVLNTIKQTSLELALIISYIMIDDPAYTHKGHSPSYLIIDEVQDNSVFEFIYALKFATWHKAALFIVGDASQTLYEFRAANPKALNTLEMSGVFEAYPLTTNYRSNQEILDFANKHLIDIDANQYAKIQLQANLLEQPTRDSFTSKVRMKVVHETTQRDFVEAIPRYLSESDVRGFIDEKLANGERVCLLSPTRYGANTAQKTLEEMYPNHKVGNLTSELAFNNTTFSQFVAKYWDVVEAVDPANASFTFVQEVMNNLRAFERNPIKAEKPTRQMLAKWWSANQYNHDNSWLPKYNWVAQNPQSSADDIAKAREEFFLTLRESILSYEISNNAINQTMKSMRNEERKKINADKSLQLLVSTIHGTKGLEFENTIVLYNPKENPDEAHKRMYYVAFTRARNAEVIIAGAGKTMPKIVTDYEMLVDALEVRDQKMAQLIANPHLQAGLSATGNTIEDIDIDAIVAQLAEDGCHADTDTVLTGLIFVDDEGNLIEADAETVAASEKARQQQNDMAATIAAAFDAVQADTATEENNAAQTDNVARGDNTAASDNATSPVPQSVTEEKPTHPHSAFVPSSTVFASPKTPQNTTDKNTSHDNS